VEHKETSREQAARRIQALLALAEDAAKNNNEALRDTYLDKASALQLKFAIEDAMLRTEDREGIEEAEFCRESNTPLIKAKRILINELASLNRGSAVMMSEWQQGKKGPKLNRRAYVRVYAHRSDLDFIRMMYTSLILQMQTMMAADERLEPKYGVNKVTNAWRVSYAYGWVRRVVARLREAKQRQEAAETASVPGTALVLADRKALVEKHLAANVGNLRKHNPRHDDRDANGRAAGRAAGDRADLGQRKVSNSSARRLEA
jgi:hypothetical protein